MEVQGGGPLFLLLSTIIYHDIFKETWISYSSTGALDYKYDSIKEWYDTENSLCQANYK